MRTLVKKKPQQRTAQVLWPHNLGGHTPSQFLAALNHEMSGITMDMIVKDVLAGVTMPKKVSERYFGSLPRAHYLINFREILTRDSPSNFLSFKKKIEN